MVNVKRRLLKSKTKSPVYSGLKVKLMSDKEFQGLIIEVHTGGKLPEIVKKQSVLNNWAYTKHFPHKLHPAVFKRKSRTNRDIEYLTFTHSEEVNLGNKVVETIPLYDNISPKERSENKAKGLKPGENRSYVYPRVFEGKREALGKGAPKGEFEPVPIDVEKINIYFEVLPHQKVPITGGKGKLKNKK